jgi:hypothetical protein
MFIRHEIIVNCSTQATMTWLVFMNELVAVEIMMKLVSHNCGKYVILNHWLIQINYWT